MCHLSIMCGVSVQLLSLGGRSSVAITHVGVGLETLKDRQGGPSIDPGIDLQRVQTMMEEMGTTLSPGAQNLMELVQCQQKVWIQPLITAYSPHLWSFYHAHIHCGMNLTSVNCKYIIDR